jgi:hypothetical protein
LVKEYPSFVVSRLRFDFLYKAKREKTLDHDYLLQYR